MSSQKVSQVHNGLVTNTREKISYALGDVGCNFIWSFTASFLTLYYTDCVGLSAAFIGTMMLMSRLLDGLSDIGMGVVIEKTQTRWGKARPWILFASMPFAISLILIMNIPGGLTSQGKNIYAFITYIFMVVICYTIVNLSYHAMLARITISQEDRNVISVVRMTLVLVSILILNTITPQVLNLVGGIKEQKAWSTVALIYASIAFVLLLICFFGTKEKVDTGEKEQSEKLPLSTSLKAIATNKYFYITALLFVCCYLVQGLNGVGIYYARDILGNTNLFGMMSIAQMVPMLIGIPLMPLLFKKFGKMQVIRGGFMISIIGSLMVLLNPYHVILYMTATVLKGIGSIPFSVAMFTLAADLVDFGEWKSGIRAEGFAYSGTSFGMKVGTGLGAALLGWLLSWGHYDASLTQQMQSAKDAMIIIAVIIPLTLSIIQLGLTLLWDLDKKYPNIQSELEARRNK